MHFRPRRPFSTSKSLVSEDQYSPKAPFSAQMHFYPKVPLPVPSERQQPDSVPTTGQHFSNEEQKIGANMFCQPNVSLT